MDQGQPHRLRLAALLAVAGLLAACGGSSSVAPTGASTGAPTGAASDAASGMPAGTPQGGRDLLAHGPDIACVRARVADSPTPTLILEPDGRAVQRLELSGSCDLVLRGTATRPGSLRIVTFDVDAAYGARVGLVGAERVEVRDGTLAVTLALGAPGPRLVEVEASWLASRGALRIESAVLVEPSPPRPPVVFISLDTFAARHTSLHGYPRQTTPRLDAFAAGATVFEHCLANAAWTTPSYLSQFTGLLPAALRVSGEQPAADPEPGLAWNEWFLPDERWTLAEMLRGAGYRTAAFVDNPMLGRVHGADQGFERFDTDAVERDQKDPEGGIRMLVPRALEWVDGLPAGEPFFLFVQANDTHGPYLPPPPFAGRFAGQIPPADPPEARVAKIPSVFGEIPTYIAEAVVGDAPLPARMATAPLIEAYDEEILLVDEAIGRLLDGLDARGLLDGAVVVISADHGESMLEHGFYFGHTTPYDEVLHVPLVLRLPDGRGAGRRVPQAVALVDLYPTLAALAGIPPRAHLHGRSLLPLADGAALPPLPIVSTEAMLRGRALHFEGWALVEKEPLAARAEQTLLSAPRAQAWLGDWLAREAPGLPDGASMLAVLDLLASSAPEQADRLRAALRHDLRGAFQELYHVAEDPLQAHDLSAEQPERVAELLERLDAELERAHEARLDVHPPPAFRLSGEELAELRQLGYVGDR